MKRLRRSDLDLYPVRSSDVDVYPVGLFDALTPALNIAKGIVPPGTRWFALTWSWRRLRSEARYIGRHLRAGHIRTARQALNGYLAEPRDNVSWTRCGHGWTRRRAWNDLQRHIAEQHITKLYGSAALTPTEEQ